MKIKVTRGPSESAAENAKVPGEVTDVEVPNKYIMFAGGIAALIPVVMTLLTFLTVTSPAAKQDRRGHRFDTQLCGLLTAVQSESAEERRTAIKLLAGLDILDIDPMFARALDTMTIPRVQPAFKLQRCASGATEDETATQVPDSATSG